MELSSVKQHRLRDRYIECSVEWRNSRCNAIFPVHRNRLCHQQHYWKHHRTIGFAIKFMRNRWERQTTGKAFCCNKFEIKIRVRSFLGLKETTENIEVTFFEHQLKLIRLWSENKLMKSFQSIFLYWSVNYQLKLSLMAPRRVELSRLMIFLWRTNERR